MKRILLPGILALSITLSAAANGPDGWEAAPDLIELQSERRPGINYHEAKVPAYELPDPLLTPAGVTVTTVEEWRAQRTHILDLFREHVYGRSPGKPEAVRFEEIEIDPEAMDGNATLKRVEIISEVADREHRFEVVLFVPNERKGPAPTFLLMNNRDRNNTDPTRDERSGFWPAEEVVERGYAIAAFQVGDVAPDNQSNFRDGVIRLFEGDVEERPDDAWAALAGWGWGAHRVMDYFETDIDIDAKRVGVVGHSRGGKASLWAGARDERFAMVVSNNSGCGGAALNRRRYGETVARINNRFPHWFCENFNRYNDNEDNLPVDQHTLIALVAPRAVYVASADRDLWADPRGEFLSLAHASRVYALWGHDTIDPEKMPPLDNPLQYGPIGYHIRSGGHNLTPYDWHRFIDLADEVLR